MYIVRPSITDINDLYPVQGVSDENRGSHISPAGLLVLMYLTQSQQQSYVDKYSLVFFYGTQVSFPGYPSS